MGGATMSGSPDNWTTTNPWEDGSWREAIRRLVEARKNRTDREHASTFASDFLTYANTAGRQLKRAGWKDKPLWALRVLDAYWLAHEFAGTIYRSAMLLDGQVDRYLRDPHHPYRARAEPQQLADRLDIAASVLLKSPLPWDLGRIEACANMGIFIAERCEEVSTHTMGLLRCSAAFAAMRRKDWHLAKEHHAQAVLVCEALLRELGDILAPSARIPQEKIHVARQAGRIVRKIGDINRKLGGKQHGDMERIAIRIFELTKTQNQLI